MMMVLVQEAFGAILVKVEVWVEQVAMVPKVDQIVIVMDMYNGIQVEVVVVLLIQVVMDLLAQGVLDGVDLVEVVMEQEQMKTVM
jgi:hypothetical protein